MAISRRNSSISAFARPRLPVSASGLALTPTDHSNTQEQNAESSAKD
jgi:hypothetical protein